MGEICFYDFSHIVYDNENRREDMMFDVITILYQCGTEFRLRHSGTRFRLDLPALQKSKSPILKAEAQKRNERSDEYAH